MARVYWLGLPPVALVASLSDALAPCEALAHVVCSRPTGLATSYPSCLVDRHGELGRAFGAAGPLAIVVDAAGRVAAVLPEPVPELVASLVTQLHAASAPVVVRAGAPVLMLDRVVEPDLCRDLLGYWHRNDKVADRVGSPDGNVVNGEVKRRLDVQVDDPGLFVQFRDCLVRRVAPAILQAFHVGTTVIEAPIVGCYDADGGGRFGRHRDNTSGFTAHRQFAVSVNLNADDEYAGGEVRFPEFGRGLYRPAAGGALVFSSSLLHEVVPVTRGRRFGAFTFLSARGPVRRVT
jgi:predicted 2-oxoglutarate/Fe(II)-dependent dioxygenase YbiX